MNTKRTIASSQCLQVAQSVGQLLCSGIPLDAALMICADGIEHRVLKAALQDQEERIRDGMFWSDALEQQTVRWPDALLNWIQIGEATGHLGDCVLHYWKEADSERRFRKGLIQSMIYPVLVLISALLSVLIMHYMLSEVHAESLTQTSTTANNSWYADNLMGIGVLILMASWVSQRAIRHHSSDSHPLRYSGLIPLRTLTLARVFNSLAMLCHCGLPLLTALGRLSAQTHRHGQRSAALARQLYHLEDMLHSGISLPDALQQLQWPSASIALAKVAEQTGDLSSFFRQLSDIYEYHTHTKQQLLINVCNPLALGVSATLILGGYTFYIWPLYANMG